MKDKLRVGKCMQYEWQGACALRKKNSANEVSETCQWAAFFDIRFRLGITQWSSRSNPARGTSEAGKCTESSIVSGVPVIESIKSGHSFLCEYLW